MICIIQFVPLIFFHLVINLLFERMVRTKAASIRNIGVNKIHPWELFSRRSILPYRGQYNKTIMGTSFQTRIIKDNATIQGLIPVLLCVSFSPVSELSRKCRERGQPGIHKVAFCSCCSAAVTPRACSALAPSQAENSWYGSGSFAWHTVLFNQS